MDSNAETIEVFATWTSLFDVEVHRAERHLIFRPRLTAEGTLQHRSLFGRPDQSERGYAPLIEALLSLGPDASDADWKAVATLLGPIIQHHPAHHARLDGVVTEHMEQWLGAQERLRRFWEKVDSLGTASRTIPAPLTPERRREEALDRLAIDDDTLASLPPHEVEALIQAHAPREKASEALDLIEAIGGELNEVFQDNPVQPSHPRIVPLINPRTFEVEIVVPQGLQALFLMSSMLLHDSRRKFLRRCKRANCGKTVFMSNRQHYCSLPCQEAEKMRRSRLKKKRQSDAH